MAEPLVDWLASLAAPALDRLARKVIHAPLETRTLCERALAQCLADPEWIARTLAHLGPRAGAVLATLARAGMPVLRSDLNALSNVPDLDPVEALEEHGLVAAVRTGRGMPTHIALTPGLETLISKALGALSHPGVAGRGAAHAGDRRRFELALLVSAVGQHPPRMTRDGRVHATDLATLAERLQPLQLGTNALEKLLGKLTESGALSPRDGRLCVVATVANDIEMLHLRLSLAELAAPSIPEGALVVVAQLVPTGATLPVREVLEAAQVALLRERANEDSTDTRRGARRELAETLTALFGLGAIVLLDAEGHPAGNSADIVLARLAEGEALSIAVEPDVAAVLRGEPRAERTYADGHVQSSFEVVADPGCDPSIIAVVGVCATLVRADRAAVLRLERKSVAAGKSLGISLFQLSEALARLSGRPVPSNVATLLTDWHTQAPEDAPPRSMGEVASLDTLRDEARAALENALAG